MLVNRTWPLATLENENDPETGWAKMKTRSAGRELFFQSLDYKLMAVHVKSAAKSGETSVVAMTRLRRPSSSCMYRIRSCAEVHTPPAVCTRR
jgi:hypothetical protein